MQARGSGVAIASLWIKTSPFCCLSKSITMDKVTFTFLLIIANCLFVENAPNNLTKESDIVNALSSFMGNKMSNLFPNTGK